MLSGTARCSHLFTGRLQLSRLVYDLLTTSHILPITAKLHQAPFDEMLQRHRVRRLRSPPNDHNSPAPTGSRKGPWDGDAAATGDSSSSGHGGDPRGQAQGTGSGNRYSEGTKEKVEWCHREFGQEGKSAPYTDNRVKAQRSGIRQVKGGEYADQVDPEAHLRINYEKYDLKLRNKVRAVEFLTP